MKKLFVVLAAMLLLVTMACSGGGGDDSSGSTPSDKYSISGTISGVVLSGIKINLTGVAIASKTTDSSGNYSFTGLISGNYTVIPSLPGYTFSPLSTDITISGASETNINFAATANIVGVNDYTSIHIGTLKYVPAGTFQRDFDKGDISTVSAFRMSEYEITRAQFLAIMGTDPSDARYSSGMNDPVQKVNWYHAIAFCNKLSIAEGFTPVYSVSGINFTTLSYSDIPTVSNATWDAATANWNANGYRLPTDMEWKWAAMGATSGYGYTSGIYTIGYKKSFAGDNPTTNEDSILDYAWIWDNSEVNYKTQPVGTKLPNELGLYDMSGNVWEWCWDWWDSPVQDSPLTNYRGPISGTERVKWGGGWLFEAYFADFQTNPFDGYPWAQDRTYGFRVVRN